MPTVSAAQERLMQAAAHTPGGYGGVPQKVGKEFVGADKKRADADDTQDCAGILFRAPGPRYLLLKRSDSGKWAQPGGHIAQGETPQEAAIRECVEEIGGCPGGLMWPARRLPVHGEASGEYTCFVQDVPEAFKPVLNDEHTGWGWFAPGELPRDVIPPVAGTIARLSGNELDIAKRIAAGELLSPQRYINVWLFDMRITGTGTSYRQALDEYVYRPPENFLTDEFRERCYGLPVIFEHPKGTILDSDEYRDRAIGSILYPYFQGDDVNGIAKVFDDDAAILMMNSHSSTSPAVVFRDAGSTETVEVDGKTVLIEGKPSYLDHLAICEVGVWDKGGDPSGINTGASEMDGTETMPAWADALMKRCDEMCSRMDAIENKGGDEMPAAELKADEHEGFDKLEHKIEGEGYGKESAEKIAGKIGEEKYGAKGMAEKAAEGRKDSEEGAKEAGGREMEHERKAEAELKEAEREGEEEMREEKRADSGRVVKEMQDQIAALQKQLSATTRPLSSEDRDELARVQARADSVMQMFGDSATPPLHGESPIEYRRRMAAKLQKHSTDMKDAKLDSIEGAMFKIAEDKIYADAQMAANSPAAIRPGVLIPHVSTDEAGRRITRFSGDMNAWMAPFKATGAAFKINRSNQGV